MDDFQCILGGIAHYRVFNTHFVILNDYKMIIDLFDKRGLNYSARPHLVSLVPDVCIHSSLKMQSRLLQSMASLSGIETAPLLLPYGKRLKTTRKLINNFLRKNSLEKQISMIEQQTYECISKIAESPARLLAHLKRQTFFSYTVPTGLALNSS